MRRLRALVLLPCWAFVMGCSGSDRPATTTADQGVVDQGALDHAAPGQDTRSGDTLQPDTQPKPPAAWAVMAPMSQARRLHTATLLQDGTVLVVGGYWYDADPDKNPDTNDGDYVGLDSAERYNPNTNTWTSAGKMIGGGHWGHQAVLLKDGRVLIIGGCNGAESFVCMVDVGVEIFDPKNTTTPWKQARPMASSRRGHRATLLPDGRVLVAGGFDNLSDLTSIEIYNPSNDTWSSPAVSLGVPHNNLTLLTLKSGRVLLAGGYNATGAQYLESLELFDPSAGTLTTLGGALQEARSNATGTLLADGRVLIVGGYCDTAADRNCVVNNAELYNPSLDRSVAAGTPGTQTIDHTATLLTDGRVLIAGGLMKPTTATLFDPQANAWTSTASLNVERTAHAAVLLADGRVLVTGGESDSAEGALASVEIYTP